MKAVNQQEYDAAFRDRKEALSHALDIRKFEIDLYWKRATYFWAFIAASFIGFGIAKEISDELLTFVFSCLGFVFSLGWYCANRGSKYWQENWENHVDLLEDKVMGPLYKTVIQRPPISTFWKHPIGWLDGILTAPSAFSVSKVNQIISGFVVFLWLIIILYSIPCYWILCDAASINAPLGILVLTTIVVLFFFGRTDFKNHDNLHARQRTASIKKPPNGKTLRTFSRSDKGEKLKRFKKDVLEAQKRRKI